MSWFKKNVAPPNDTRLHRTAITVDCTGKTQGDAVRVVVNLAKFAEFDHLWENMGTNGANLEATGSDGYYEIDLELVSVNSTARTGTLRIAYTCKKSGAVELIWLYYGSDGSPTASADTAATGTGDVDGNLTQDAPLGYPVVRATAQAPESTTTRDRIAKDPDDDAFVTFELPELTPTNYPINGSKLYEEISTLTMQVLAGATDQPSMYSLGDARFFAVRGRMFVRVLVVDGNSGTDYGIQITVETTLGRVHVRRAGLIVRRTTE